MLAYTFRVLRLTAPWATTLLQQHEALCGLHAALLERLWSTCWFFFNIEASTTTALLLRLYQDDAP
jgi:hypothetical protein